MDNEFVLSSFLKQKIAQDKQNLENSKEEKIQQEEKTPKFNIRKKKDFKKKTNLQNIKDLDIVIEKNVQNNFQNDEQNQNNDVYIDESDLVQPMTINKNEEINNDIDKDIFCIQINEDDFSKLFLQNQITEDFDNHLEQNNNQILDNENNEYDQSGFPLIKMNTQQGIKKLKSEKKDIFLDTLEDGSLQIRIGEIKYPILENKMKSQNLNELLGINKSKIEYQKLGRIQKFYTASKMLQQQLKKQNQFLKNNYCQKQIQKINPKSKQKMLQQMNSVDNNSNQEENLENMNFDTKLEEIQRRFKILDVIKKSSQAASYYVEENFRQPSEQNPIFYLKQYFFNNKKEFNFYMDYYLKFYNYFQQRTANKEVAGLVYIFEYDDPMETNFEIVIVLEFGETDRIDVKQIENSHINKFMKNVSNLLSEVKKQLFRPHGNIKLKNIVLSDRNLKLSCYKPIFDDGKSKTWKEQIVRKVGPFRLDLFLLGCLWIEFLGFDLEEIYISQNNLKFVQKKINHIIKNEIKNETESDFNLLQKLLDIDNNPSYEIEELMLDFSEKLLLEHQDSEHVKSKNSNIFQNSLKESIENSSYKKTLDQPENQNIIKIDNNFTLQQKSSINEQNFFEENNNEIQEKQQNSQIQSQKLFLAQKNKEQEEKPVQQQIQAQVKKSISFGVLQQNQDNKINIRNFQTNDKKLLKELTTIPQENEFDQLIEKKRQKDIQKQQQMQEESSEESEDLDINNELEYLKQNYKNEVKDIESKREIEKQSLRQIAENNSKQNNVQEQQPQKEVSKNVKNIQNLLDFGSSKRKQKQQEEQEYYDQDQDQEHFINIQSREDSMNDDLQNVEQQLDYLIVQNSKKLESMQSDDSQNNNELQIQIQQQKSIENLESDKNIIDLQVQEMNKKNNSKIKTKKNQKDSKKQQVKNLSYSNMFKKQKTNQVVKNNPKKTRNKSENKIQSSNKNKVKDLDKRFNYLLDKAVSKEKKFKMELKQKDYQSLIYDTSTNRSLLQNLDLSIIKQDSLLDSKSKSFYETLTKAKNQSNVQNQDTDFDRRQTLPLVLNSLQTNQSTLKNKNPIQIQTNPGPHQSKRRQTDFMDNKSNISFNTTNFNKYKLNFDENFDEFKNYDSFLQTERRQSTIKNKPQQRHRYFSISDASMISQTQPREKSYFDKKLPQLSQRVNTQMNKTPLRREKILENFKTYSRKPSVDQSDNQKPFKTLNKINNLMIFSKTKLEPVKAFQKKNQEHEHNHDLDTSCHDACKGLDVPIGRDFYTNNKLKQPKYRKKNKKRSQISKKLKQLQQQQQETQEDKNEKFTNLYKMEYDYAKNLELLKQYIKNKEYQNALQLLDWIKILEEGQRKIDAYKIQGMLYFQQGKQVDALETLEEGMDYINTQQIKNKEFLQQDFLLRMAMIYLDQRTYEIAQDYLLDEVFDQEFQPFDYLTILGDIFFQQEYYLSAFDNYYKQILRMINQNLNEKIYKEFIKVANKCIHSLLLNDEEEILVKFIKYIIDVAKSMVKNQEIVQQNNNYINMKDIVIVDILSLIWTCERDNVFNYIINQVLKRKLIEIKKLPTKKYQELFVTLFYFNQKLSKLQNYGDHKKTFLLINEKLVQMIPQISSEEKYLRKKIAILFNHGLFLLHEGNETKAQEMFQSCIQLFYSESQLDNQKFQNLLYRLAEFLYSKKIEKSALYFLQHIIKYQSGNQRLLKQSQDLFARSEYKIGNINESPQHLESWLVSSMQSYSSFKNKYCKNLILLTFLIWKNLSKKIKFLPNLEKFAKEQQENELQHYVFVIQQMIIYMKKKNLKLNQEICTEIKQQLYNFDFPTFMKILNKFYCENILIQKYTENKEEIILCFRNQFYSYEENLDIIKVFILNFYFLVINGTSLNGEMYLTKKERDKLQDQIRFLQNDKNFKKNFEQIYQDQGPFFTNHEHKSEQEKMKERRKSKSPVPKSIKNVNIQKSVKNVNIPRPKKTIPELLPKKKQKSIQKQQVTRKFSEFKNQQDITLDENCICYQFNINNMNLMNKIEEVMSKFKNFESQDNKKFFQQMKTLMDSQKQTYQKFCYIPKFFDFYLAQQKNELNVKKFHGLLKSLFEMKGICIHDFKNIFYILNTFQNLKYFQEFFNYVYEKKHDWFIKLSEELIIKELYEEYLKFFNQIFASYINQKLHLNSVFQKQFNFQLQNLNHDLKYHLKYELFNQQSFVKQIIIKLGSKKVHNVLTQFYFVEAIKNINNNKDFENIIKIYIEKIKNYFSKNNPLKNQEVLFNFFFLLMFSNRVDPSLVEIVVQFISELSSMIIDDLFYAYVQICVWFGAYLYRQDYFNETSKVLSFAFEFLKHNPKSSQINNFRIETQEEMLFSVFAYWYMCQIQLKNYDLSISCLNKLNGFTFKSDYLQKLLILMNYYSLKIVGKKSDYVHTLEKEDLRTDNQQQSQLLGQVKKYLLSQII